MKGTIVIHTAALSVSLRDGRSALGDVEKAVAEIERCGGAGQKDLAKSRILDRSAPLIYKSLAFLVESNVSRWYDYLTRTQKASLSPMCIKSGPTTKPRPWQYPIFSS